MSVVRQGRCAGLPANSDARIRQRTSRPVSPGAPARAWGNVPTRVNPRAAGTPPLALLASSWRISTCSTEGSANAAAVSIAPARVATRRRVCSAPTQ